MTMQCSLVSDEIRNFEVPSSTADFIKAPSVIGSAYQGSEDCQSGPGLTKPDRIGLNLENLKCFEVVERQFQDLDVIFRNAIALQPSNPAFPARSGTTVLLGAPKNGFLEIIFQQPVSFVSGYVTSSKRTILTAYDHDDKQVARTEIPEPNLAGSDSGIPPNTEMRLSAPNIHRITFYAFDGQLTVDDLSFSF